MNKQKSNWQTPKIKSQTIATYTIGHEITLDNFLRIFNSGKARSTQKGGHYIGMIFPSVEDAQYYINYMELKDMAVYATNADWNIDCDNQLVVNNIILMKLANKAVSIIVKTKTSFKENKKENGIHNRQK